MPLLPGSVKPLPKWRGKTRRSLGSIAATGSSRSGPDKTRPLRSGGLPCCKRLSEAAHHGLPDMTATANALMDKMAGVRSTRDLGEVEVALSRALVDYTRDIQTGLLVPARIDEGMVRKKRKIDITALLAGMETDRPFAYMQSLVPQSQQYRALMREKLRLEATMNAGGWGPRLCLKARWKQAPKGPKLSPCETALWRWVI